MHYSYYKLVLDTEGVTAGRSLATCSIGDSISQHLYLLICTGKGEMPSNPEFGCAIRDLQFEMVIDQRKWQATVEASILEGIQRFERRLVDPAVQVNLSDVEVTYPFKQYPDIRKQATVHVTGKLRHTRETFSFSTKIYVSPLSN